MNYPLLHSLCIILVCVYPKMGIPDDLLAKKFITKLSTKSTLSGLYPVTARSLYRILLLLTLLWDLFFMTLNRSGTGLFKYLSTSYLSNSVHVYT